VTIACRSTRSRPSQSADFWPLTEQPTHEEHEERGDSAVGAAQFDLVSTDLGMPIGTEAQPCARALASNRVLDGTFCLVPSGLHPTRLRRRSLLRWSDDPNAWKRR
jgi:hypothetical protein